MPVVLSRNASGDARTPGPSRKGTGRRLNGRALAGVGAAAVVLLVGAGIYWLASRGGNAASSSGQAAIGSTSPAAGAFVPPRKPAPPAGTAGAPASAPPSGQVDIRDQTEFGR